VRIEEECVCSVCLFRCIIFIGVRIIKEIPGSVVSGTLCTSINIFEKLQVFCRNYTLKQNINFLFYFCYVIKFVI